MYRINMKKLCLTITSLLAIINLSAQAPSWSWFHGAGGSNDDRGHSLAIDNLGNIYLAGAFWSDTLFFGSTMLLKPDTIGNYPSAYIAKYDPLGNIIWVQSFGKNFGIDPNLAITVDASGNLFFTGSFVASSIIFGNDTLTNVFPNGYYGDFFIVKFDSSGNVLWARHAGGSSTDIGESISTDAAGNAYVTGWYWSNTIVFGTDTLLNTFGHDFFCVKYDPSGNILWTKGNIGPTGWDEGRGTSVDNSGNLYLTGYFNAPSIAFDSIVLNNTTITGFGPDLFVVKYNSSGNVQWARSAGGTSNDIGNSIVTDAYGNVYVTGDFISDTMFVGSTTLVNNSLNSNIADLFIIKYDSLGNVLWAKSEGGVGADYANFITISPVGNIFLIGNYSNSITFGSTTHTSIWGQDVFIVSYDTSGNVLWSKSINSIYNDFGNCIAADASGALYITGFGGPMIFDQDTMNYAGSWDVFFGKLEPTLVGISKSDVYKELNLYPNPSSGIFYIKSNSKIQSVEVFNMMGELVLSQGNANIINLQAYPKGIYVARINGSQVCRLVKE
jgi:hypothetical protein